MDRWESRAEAALEVVTGLGAAGESDGKTVPGVGIQVKGEAVEGGGGIQAQFEGEEGDGAEL